MQFVAWDMFFGNPTLMMIKTLRTRLTLWHAATLTLLLGLLLILCYGVLARALHRHHDDELEVQAEAVAQALGNQPLTDAAIRTAVASASIGSRWVLIRDTEGRLLYQETWLRAGEREVGEHEALVHAATMGAVAPQFFTVRVEPIGDVRFICIPLRTGRAYVQIGNPMGDVGETLHTIVMAALPLIPVVLLLSSVVGWVLAKRALAPMERVTVTLQAIQASDLSRRIDVRTKDAEMTTLVTTLNRLLDRLQRAFDSLRQFAGDVSHQLQTPLTIMKGTLETAQRPTATLGPIVDQLGQEVDDMTATLADLRAFALADAPVSVGATVDFSECVRDATEIVAALGELAGVDVAAEVASGVHVLGDAIRLKQVVLNLGDNAVKYTPRGGSVTIALRPEDNQAQLTVSDTGRGIPRKDLSRIFDRFYRVLPQDTGHSGTGLGLSIAKRIIEAHGGTIQVTSEPGQQTTFTVILQRVLDH
jgi:signal transduction histidine kinase